MLLPRCVGLTRKRCSMLNLTLFWTSVPARTHSLSWATSILTLALRELATSYVLVAMARNNNSTLLLNFTKSRRLRIAGSWYQTPKMHRWTCYSNAGRVAKEIDHILVSTCWRILQNCRVFQSAEFFATDHRLVVATLKLHVKSRKISRCDTNVYHLENLKNLICAHE